MERMPAFPLLSPSPPFFLSLFLAPIPTLPFPDYACHAGQKGNRKGINVMEYFKLGEKMRIMYYSVSETGILGKKLRVLLSGVEHKSSRYCCSDVLPLSYRRLVGAKAIKLGSWKIEKVIKCT